MTVNYFKQIIFISIFVLISLECLVAKTAVQTQQAEQNRVNLLTFTKITKTLINQNRLSENQQRALTQLELAIQNKKDPFASKLIAALTNPFLPQLSVEYSRAYHKLKLTEGSTLSKNQLFDIVLNPVNHMELIVAHFGYSTNLPKLSKPQQISKPILTTITDHGTKTLTPSVNTQTLASGYYDSVSITGSANLIPSNIGAGNSIFNVSGSYSGYGSSITDATVTANTLLSGMSLYNANGVKVIGTIPSHGVSTVIPTSTSQTLPEGYYTSITVAGNANLTPAHIRSGVQIWSVTSDGNTVDTSSGSASASEISSGKVAFVQGIAVTGNLGSSTLSSTSTVVNTGVYAATDLTNVDADLVSTNLKSGANVFGVLGSSTVVDTSVATATAADIVSSKTAYVKGVQITGTLNNASLSSSSTSMPAGVYTATTLNSVDSDLTPINIASGVNIFGVVGTFTTNTSSGNASAQHILSGLTAWVNGAKLTGTLANQVLSSANAILAAGNYSAGNLSSIDTDLIATNLASGVNVFGVVGIAPVVNTASATAAASDILSLKTAFVKGSQVTGNLSTQTFTNINSNMAAGYYATTNLTTVEANLIAANLKSGANVFGVLGTSTVLETSGANAQATDLLNSKTAYVVGNLITGSISNKTLTSHTPVFATGNYATANLQLIDTDLVATNLSAGTNIFGVLGSASNTTSGNASTVVILAGAKAWVAGNELTGILASPTLSPATVVFSSGNYSANLAVVDTDLNTANLASGTNIFGVMGNSTVVNTSVATATAAGLKSGKTAFVQGSQITGTLPNQTLSSTSPVVAAGFYSATDLTTVSANLVSSNVISGGNIFGVMGNAYVVNTASANATANDILSGRTGYVKGAQVTGSIANLSFSENTYLFSAGNYSATTLATVESNLNPSNIASGVNIFGMTGIAVDTSGANVLASQVISGKTVWVGGTQVTGNLANQVLTNTTHLFSAGNYSNTNLSTIDTDLSANNLVYGANIFGVVGSNASVVNTASGNTLAHDLFTGFKGYSDGVELQGTGVILDTPATVATNTVIATSSANFQYTVELNYCIVDVSGGPTATHYPITYTDVRPDLTGPGNLQYKTDKIVLKWIPAGVFIMGNVTVGGSANIEHPVSLTKDYWVGVFETTQQQWLNIMGSYPSGTQSYTNSNNTMPVHSISWEDIRGASSTYDWPNVSTIDPNTFMGKLLSKTGLRFDLPTEAEFEYVSRAGTITLWTYGASSNTDYQWDNTNSNSTTHEVGSKLPNPWGLYNLHGNIREWCLDYYIYNNPYPSSSLQINPLGISSGSYRLWRGASFADGPLFARPAHRNVSENNPTSREQYIGFRIYLRNN